MCFDQSNDIMHLIAKQYFAQIRVNSQPINILIKHSKITIQLQFLWDRNFLLINLYPCLRITSPNTISKITIGSLRPSTPIQCIHFNKVRHQKFQFEKGHTNIQIQERPPARFPCRNGSSLFALIIAFTSSRERKQKVPLSIVHFNLSL